MVQQTTVLAVEMRSLTAVNGGTAIFEPIGFTRHKQVNMACLHTYNLLYITLVFCIPFH